MSEKIKSIENSINDRLPDQLVGIVQCRPIYGAYCFARKWVFDFLSRKIDFLDTFHQKKSIFKDRVIDFFEKSDA